MSICASFEDLSDGGLCRVGVLRIHPEQGSWESRQGWSWACTMRVRNDFAQLFGAATSPPWAARKVLKELFISMGITQVEYEIKGRIIKRKVIE